ncbi:hypothetical protein [Thermococcus sp. AM4]|uniref:hypothetical protein n=1 Tax=Thermococcus sp. (strain AM4) TaxID=246969 RepID=UPI0011D285E7|nr:hypothetical protein [Thermococcus sp. AM4]
MKKEIREITYSRISNVIDPNAEYFEIIGSLSGKGIRIGAGDEGSSIVSWTRGVRGLLLPGHIDSANTSRGFIWVTLLKNGSERIIRAFYPGMILEHKSHTAEERPSFTGLFLQKTLNNTSIKLENLKTPEFDVLRFHVIQNRIVLDVIWKVSPEQICHAQKDLLRNTTDGPVCYYKTR